MKGRLLGNRGIGIHHVQATPCVHGLLDHAGARIGVERIVMVGLSLSALRANHRHYLCGTGLLIVLTRMTAVVDQHQGPTAGQLQADSPADALARTGHDHHTPCQ